MSTAGKNLLAYRVGTTTELVKKLGVVLAFPHDKKNEDDPKNWWWQAKKLQEMVQVQKSDPVFAWSPLEICLLSLLAGEDLKEANEAEEKVALVADVLGITTGVVQLMSFEQVVDVVQGKQKDFQLNIFLRSVAELSADKDAARLGAAIADRFVTTPPSYMGDQTWSEAVLFVVLAFAAYAHFEATADKAQTNLLGHCYFYALALGVPVREALERALYETRTLVTYIDVTKLFADSLRVNVEEIVLTQDKKTTFGALAQEYLRTAGDEWPTDAQQKKYLATLSNGLSANVVDCLERSFTIFRHLQHADLVDHNRGGELTEAEQYQNDMIQLLFWFGIGADGAESLVKYFKQDNPRVPVRAFILRLREVSDLSDQVTMDNVLELTEMLHSKKLLDHDQELVEFHEQDEQFHWNDAFIV